MSSERTYNEKRDFIRMKINSAVVINHQGTEYKGVCKDLSGAGMSVATQESLTVGDKVQVSIETQDDSHLPFNATASVSRVDSNDGGYLIGLSIVEIEN
jgi:hypothetical protein